MLPDEAVQAVRIAVGLLAEPHYDTLERMIRGRHLTAAMMAGAVRRYGRTLARPPAEAYEGVDAIEGQRDGTRVYAVDFPLWTDEGRSDLRIHLTLVEVMDGVYGVEIDDIRVP